MREREGLFKRYCSQSEQARRRTSCRVRARGGTKRQRVVVVCRFERRNPVEQVKNVSKLDWVLINRLE